MENTIRANWMGLGFFDQLVNETVFCALPECKSLYVNDLHENRVILGNYWTRLSHEVIYKLLVEHDIINDQNQGLSHLPRDRSVPPLCYRKTSCEN